MRGHSWLLFVLQIIQSKFFLIPNLLLDAVIQMISSLMTHLILKVEYTINHKSLMYFLIFQLSSKVSKSFLYPFHLSLSTHIFSFFIISILCSNDLSLALSMLNIEFFHFSYQISEFLRKCFLLSRYFTQMSNLLFVLVIYAYFIFTNSLQLIVKLFS